MERSKKQQIVEEIREVLSKASSCIAVDFSGVNMETFTPLRKECATSNVKIIVVKNTLARIAVKGSPYEGVNDLLKGMTSLVLTLDSDLVKGARIIKKFAKKDERIIVKGGVIDGKLLTSKEVNVLADLPGKEELQAKLLATMLAVPQSFVRLLAAYKEKLETAN
ncbi:MAG TPA: 50S ribosomal protein L10 [bacterium]|mgnify:CR=1 FL=1|nr:50S ribosomal protein L10 [bacterium]HPS29692.1 50S ribosomal protein L10 [bacterium]